MVWCLGDKILCAKSPHSTRSCLMSQYYVCINRQNLKLLSARGGRFLADFFPAKCCFLNDNKQPLQASPLTLKLKLRLKIHEKCAPSTLSRAVKTKSVPLQEILSNTTEHWPKCRCSQTRPIKTWERAVMRGSQRRNLTNAILGSPRVSGGTDHRRSVTSPRRSPSAAEPRHVSGAHLCWQPVCPGNGISSCISPVQLGERREQFFSCMHN